jgi:hypothetical protein
VQLGRGHAQGCWHREHDGVYAEQHAGFHADFQFRTHEGVIKRHVSTFYTAGASLATV